MSEVHFIKKPTVTMVAQTQWAGEPEHAKTNFQGYATGGERLVEFAGRACYQSFANEKGGTNAEYLAHILESRHGSVLEHDNISLYVEGVSRNLTHEQVRHRAGVAYSQLSQRYVDESSTAFVVPPLYLLDGFPVSIRAKWEMDVATSRAVYIGQTSAVAAWYKDRRPDLQGTDLRKAVREATRSILPGSCETRIVLTGNMRAWRHMLEMRGSPYADREICRLYAEFIFPILKAARHNILQDFEQFTAPDGRIALRCQYGKV